MALIALLDAFGTRLIPESPATLFFARIITESLSEAVLATVAFAIALALLLRGHRRTGAFIVIVMALNLIIIHGLKLITERVRPTEVVDLGYSFPSGHAMTAIVFFGMLSYFAFLHLRRRTAYAIASAGALLTLLVGWSRVALQVHWLSDVLAAYALGAVLLLSAMLVERRQREKGHRKSR